MRIINIFEEINEETYKDILIQIMDITEEIRKIDIDNQGLPPEEHTPKPHVLVNICCPGGDVYQGFAIVDALKNCGTKVITNGLGYVGSMGFVIFMCGDIRKSSKNTRFMYHSCSGGTEGNVIKTENYLTELKRINSQVKRYLYDQGCKIESEKLDNIIKNQEDFEFGYEEAIQYNVINTI